MSTPPTSLLFSSHELDEILGSRPVLPTEDERAYDALTKNFRLHVKPRDILEDVLVRDVIDLTWEIQRLKDFKKQLLLYEHEDFVKAALDKIFGPYGYDPKLRDEYVKRNPIAVKNMKAELAKRGHDFSVFDALNFRRNLEIFERLDRQILQAEARRAAHLKEIDRHRSALADQVRDALLTIEHDEPTETSSDE